MNPNYLAGINTVGPTASVVVAAPAGLQTLYTIPLALVGVKTAKLRSLHVLNNSGGDTFIHIGTGTAMAFVDQIPAIKIINGFDDTIYMDSEYEFSTDILCYCDAVPVVARADVEVIG